MPSSLTHDDQQHLERLLNHIIKYDHGFMPEEIYRTFHKLVPWPAVEVIVHDEDRGFVLKHRRDRDFDGWHIPGGYLYVNETLQHACDRHAQKDNVAEAVTNLRLIATHAWLEGEHPFGYPLSLIFVCEAVDEIVEKPDVRWFREVPDALIHNQHPLFLAYLKTWLTSARETAAII